jgi:hypothetical protein
LPKRVRPLLTECKKSRASWLKAVGLTAALAAATIDLFIGGQPLVSLAAASAVLAVVSDDLIAFVSKLPAFHSDRRRAKGHGLQYLMKVK